MFTGFTNETVDFMWGIRFHNERPWFEAHKETYLNCFYNPMRELGAEIFDYIQARRPDQPLVCKVTRIYRDARRLHGRGPYKDHLWFCVEQPAEDWTARPTFWFELAPEYWSYGMGYWMTRPTELAKLRARITRDPATMSRLTRKLNRNPEFSLDGQQYKKPRGTAPSPLLAPWYQMKSIAISHEEPLAELLFSRELVERLQTGYQFLLPFYDYFLTIRDEPEPETLY